jgi:hypothetical protein
MLIIVVGSVTATGWTTSATVNGSVTWDTFGFPANSARLGASNPPPGLPVGSAAITA